MQAIDEISLADLNDIPADIEEVESYIRGAKIIVKFHDER